MKRATEKNENEDLLHVLAAHYKALVAARSDDTVLRKYSLLLRFLKTRNGSLFKTETSAKSKIAQPRGLSNNGLSEEELTNASLDEVERLVSDPTTPRKELERIAIRRFSVPRGSMRSFSNRQMLEEKLRTLINSERTHETIGVVAREQGRLSSEF